MSGSYPSNWDSLRKKVYKRDNYECQNCGRRGGPHGDSELQAHHIVPKRNGGLHRMGNLRTLCKGCHDAITYDQNAPTAATSQRTFGYGKTSEDTADSAWGAAKQEFNAGRKEVEQELENQTGVENTDGSFADRLVMGVIFGMFVGIPLSAFFEGTTGYVVGVIFVVCMVIIAEIVKYFES